MLILLPPSEAKARARAGDPYDFNHAPTPVRPVIRRVRKVLISLCRKDPLAAGRALKLGARGADLIDLNAHLDTEPCAPAAEVYTGVLFDSLNLADITPAARAWADTHLAISSALFGLVQPADEIPAYRLSAGTSLPGLPPLPKLWQPAIQKHLAALPAVDSELIFDLRSGPYAGLWRPRAAWSSRVVVGKVWHEGADGRVRATSHANKAVKGRLIRDLAHAGVVATDPSGLTAAMNDLGWSAQQREGHIDILDSSPEDSDREPAQFAR